MFFVVLFIFSNNLSSQTKTFKSTILSRIIKFAETFIYQIIKVRIMKVKYQEGVFKPLEKIKDIKEGEVVEISIERHEWNKFAMSNPSFDFLKNEPDIYTEADIINKSE